MKRNSILYFVATVLAVMALAGNVQAAVTAQGGVNSTVADGEIATLWLDVDPSDYVTAAVMDGGEVIDYFFYSDLTFMLDRNGYNSGDTGIPVTVAMYCSGTERDIDGAPGGSYTNTYKNVTVVRFTVDYEDGTYYPSSYMELEPCTTPDPDLIVESITANCGGYLFGNQSNTISAVIENIDAGNAPASHASFVLSGGYSETVAVPALNAGENTTVSITDPTIRSAGVDVTIDVTADSDAEVSESDETNNVAVQSETVYNNGYKGKTYTGGPNMTTWKTYDLNGSLVYSPGDSYYLSAYYNPGWTTYDVAWTAGDLPVPGTAAIKEARLYVIYTSDKASVMPNEVALSFNGVAQTYDAHYSDRKGYDGYDSPYGVLTYNVTSNFSTAGNIANLTNNHLGGANASMRGMELVVIYEDDTEPHRLIFINEEFDLLYGGSGKCTTPDEATAWAPITGPRINTATVANATLITFAPGADGSGSAGEGELIFNGEVWNDEWTDNEVHQIGVSDRDVTSYLQSTDNLVGFQSNGDYMEASNAFLVVEIMDEVVVAIDPCAATIGSDPTDRKTVNISLSGIADYGSGTIHLYYDPLVVEVDAIGNGDSKSFRSNPVYPPSTSPYQGGGHVEISAFNTSGVDGDVAFVNVTFRPTGVSSDCTSLNLTVETLYDRNYAALQTVVNNCSLCIVESNKPIVSPPIATPAVILNDTLQMRARVQQAAAPYCTNVTNLTVFVTDDTEVAAVYVNLTPILGAGHNTVKMTGPDGSAAGTWYNETNASYSSLNQYSLNVMAVDRYGEWNNGSSFTLKVDRRGDVRDPSGTLAADNKVNAFDYYYIARYTVGLESAPENCTAQVQPADSWDGVDMADALYIAMYVAHGPPLGTYPAP